MKRICGSVDGPNPQMRRAPQYSRQFFCPLLYHCSVVAMKFSSWSVHSLWRAATITFQCLPIPVHLPGWFAPVRPIFSWAFWAPIPRADDTFIGFSFASPAPFLFPSLHLARHHFRNLGHSPLSCPTPCPGPFRPFPARTPRRAAGGGTPAHKKCKQEAVLPRNDFFSIEMSTGVYFKRSALYARPHFTVHRVHVSHAVFFIT